jgi:hypothetical protein
LAAGGTTKEPGFRGDASRAVCALLRLVTGGAGGGPDCDCTSGTGAPNPMSRGGVKFLEVGE